MNKYQKALNKIVKSCCPNCIDENGCSSCDIEKICNATAKSWVNILQELVDKEKIYTEEEIKKEWEKLGYEWEKREHIIFLCNKKTEKMISINAIIRGYSSYNFDAVSLIITFQEHQLLHKLFELWGWFDE